MAKNYKPDIEYVVLFSAFLNIKTNPVQGDGYIKESFVQTMIDQETETIEGQIINYNNLAIPDALNKLPVGPVKNLIAARVTWVLLRSYFQSSDREKQWAQVLKDAEKEFSENCLFYLARSAGETNISQGFYKNPTPNIMP